LTGIERCNWKEVFEREPNIETKLVAEDVDTEIGRALRRSRTVCSTALLSLMYSQYVRALAGIGEQYLM